MKFKDLKKMVLELIDRIKRLRNKDKNTQKV